MENEKIIYWSLQKEELLRQFSSSEAGLNEAEVKRRLKENGLNEIPHVGHRTAINIFLSQFKSPLIYVLVFASVMASFLGETTEAIIIVAITLVNTVLGFVQEYRTEHAVEELRKYLAYSTVVLRDGKKQTIDTKELVLGDIVFLEIGDVVPAEVRLLDVNELQTDESALTGESIPVDKTTKPIELINPAPHQLTNTALMGSIVTNGSATGLVVATGRLTFFGKTASTLLALPPATDFQKNIASFGSFLIKVILLLVGFVFFVNSILGRGVLESLLFSLALAVGIIPEALPVIITVGLSNGALVLASKKVVVKKLEAIEDLGNVDVLCTDKTGTLTQNEIRVNDIVDLEDQSQPELMKYALLCNTAIVEGDKILGNQIDTAIWKKARSRGFNETTLNNFTRIHEIPFQYNRRRMSIIVESDGHRLLISKGAPESILSVSTSAAFGVGIQSLSQISDRIKSLVAKYSQTGNRLIALAYKEIENKPEYSIKDENQLTFIGLLVLLDPPKEDAAEAVSRLQSLNIKLKILSGDDPLVTATICHKVGINGQERIITGSDVEGKNENELRQIVEKSDVYGRITPDQKYAIVNALKKNGHVTGFLGDGVNDAPALKLADAGISVESGVQVAKEASSIILLQKSLSVIAEGVTEGRKAFGNMIKYINNTTSANFGNMITIAMGSLFFPFILLLPSQILLTNLISDAPLLTISTDRLDEESLRAPRRMRIKNIARFVIFFGLISSIFDFVTIYSIINIIGASMELFRTGWFIESVLSEILVTFSIRTRRRFYKSRPSNLLIATSVIMIITTLVIVYSPFGSIFEFVAPPLWFLGLILGILASYFFLVESLKHIFFAHFRSEHELLQAKLGK
ncbi:MAG: P-type Mg2+ transporter [Thermoproteota archaeon]|nr:P-type Mg2+ transporter [Thermoproteota archaeon]